MCQSVANQTYPNIKHLIINKASNDGTIECVKQAEKSANPNHKFRYISEPDTGIYNVFNKGIRIAKGEYILFMGSDDKFLDKNAVTLLVEALENKNADFSCANAVILKANGRKIKKIANLNIYPFSVPFCHQTMLTKKSLFFDPKYGFFDEQLCVCADGKFILKLLLDKKKGVIVNKDLILFRAIGNSIKEIELGFEEYASVIKEYIYSDKLNIKHIKNIVAQKTNLITMIKFLCMGKIKDKSINKDIFLTKKIYCRAVFKDLIRLRFVFKRIETYFKKFKYKNLKS